MNTPTPETDAEVKQYGLFHAPWPNVPASFARKLERERDEARRDVNYKCVVERDQLHKELFNLKNEMGICVCPSKTTDEACASCITDKPDIRFERDQLRKVCDELVKVPNMVIEKCVNSGIRSFEALQLSVRVLESYNSLPHIQERNTEK